MNRKVYSSLFTLCLIFPFLFSCQGGNDDTSSKSHTPTIVLLHGLGDSPENFLTMQAVLQKDFPQARILPLYDKESHQHTITHQAQRAYQQLQAHNVSDKAPLILVAHSQGGLVAYQLYQQFGGKQLNIKGLVTIGTPWEGIPVINKQEEIKDSLLPLLATLETLAPESLQPLLQEAGLVLANMPLQGPALDDMQPNSAFLQSIATSLKDNQLPTLAIAGDASELLQKLKAENPTLAPLVLPLEAMISTAPHDLLVPVRSQRAEGIQASNLNRHTVKNAAHFAILGIPSSSSELQHAEILQKIKEFVSQKL